VTETSLDHDRLALLRRRLGERGLTAPAAAPATAPPDRLSDGALRMWFTQAADPSGALLNICVSYRLTGTLDPARLHQAVDAVARRHPVLRTTYHPDPGGEPRPRIEADLRPGWAVHDLSELPEQARQLRLEVLAQREFATPFDLAADAPLRLTLVRTGPADYLLLLVAHHIAWDDGSWRVFFADLTRAYCGEELTPAPHRAATPADPDTTAADLAYWRSVLADPPEPLELPGANGSAVPTGWRCARTATRLAPATAQRVAALARETGATPYMVLLAMFGALIHRVSHAEDFLIVAPVLNRGADADDAIGYHGNTVAMRLRPTATMTFRDLLAQTRDTAAGAFAHQRINLDRVVRELNPDRRHGAERLTRLSFGFRELDDGGFCPPGVRSRRAELRGNLTQLPLGLMIEFDRAGVLVEAEHLLEVLEPALAAQLLEHFAVLVDGALAAPDTPLARLPLLDETGAAWLRRQSLGEPFQTEPQTLGGLIEAQVQRTPDAVAMVYEGRSYSYREVNAAANRVAHRLIGAGIGAEDRVAVLLDKSPELIITALGVVKAGAVYLPVDPGYPADRLSFILADCDAKLVITEPLGELDDERADNPTDTDRVRPLGPANTAYLIYTSGTTGQPKGVPVPHRPIAEYFVWFKGEYQVDAADRMLQVASPSFDISIAEVFGMLACGARIIVPKPGGLNDIGYLTDLLRDQGVTAMHFVPSLLALFLSLPGVSQWRSLRRVPIGGEPLPGEVADKFHATFDALLHNFYGPTETIVNASRYRVEGKQGTRIVPIGKPKINTAMYLLDDALQPVPVGVIGEIYIGGTHLAHGYHRRSGLTAERFVADPHVAGARMYRSGDLARRNADGDIEFVGRADEQVKIRGFRIELGDVAAAISVDPSVGQAVVLVRDLPQLGRSLVGYLTPVAGAPVESVQVDRIRTRVAAALPEYMVPAGYLVLEQVPITAHGKIDRAALPDPQIPAATAYREPAAGTEHRVAELFGELLGRDRIGADDSFFDLGGHSLLATKLVACVRSSCDVEIGVREVFEYPTVAELAGHIDALAAGTAGPARPPLVAVPRGGPMPLSSAQLRTWFSYRVEGPSTLNNIPFAARLTGPVDLDALRRAVGDVVDRHEILRTSYREIDGVPYQVVHPAAGVAVRVADGCGADWVAEQLAAERAHVFDLENQWPLRAAILRADDEHVLALTLHHIAGDHWSAGVLFTDLLVAYRARCAGAAPNWAPLPVQYADYGRWQGELFEAAAGVLDPQREYWIAQLADLPEEAGLAPDFPRPPVLDTAGDSITFNIGAGVRARLAALAADLGVTEFMVLQAAVAVALHKAGAGLDVPIGSPVAGRTAPELDQLIGFFINILVLRNDLSGNPTVREILRRTREMALDAYQHQDLPFDQVVDAVSPVRSLSRNPLFGVVVHLRDALPADRVIDPGSGPGVAPTRFTALEPDFDAAHADLQLSFFAGDDGYRCHAIYRCELYRPDTIARFADWLTRVLTAFAENPAARLSDIDVLTDAEREKILTFGAGAGGGYVLDELLNPVPVRVAGELYCAGALFAQARLPRPADTAARLVANPIPGAPGSRLYRTGWRARWDADGQLEILGPAGPAAARAPAAPRRAEPPSTDTERALAGLLAEVLDVADVARHDEFFALGGDSILAVQLASRARDAGLALTARMVFEHPALAELAAAVDARAAAPGAAHPDADTHHEPMAASGLSEDELASLTASWGGTP